VLLNSVMDQIISLSLFLLMTSLFATPLLYLADYYLKDNKKKYKNYKGKYLKYAMWSGIVLASSVVLLLVLDNVQESEDNVQESEEQYGLGPTVGKTYFVDHTEFDGYFINDDFKELVYLGAGVFKIDGIDYNVISSEKDDIGNREYILTLDKKKVVEGESFTIYVNVNINNGDIRYDVWYKVYGHLFLTVF